MTDKNKMTAIGVTIIIFSGIIFVYFINIFLDSSDNIKAAIMSGSIAMGIAIYAQYKSKKREAENRLFETKANAYKKFIDLYFDDIFLKIKKGEKVDIESKEFLTKLFEVKKEFFIWASPETLKSFSEIGSTQDTSIVFTQINSLFANIRNYLGHKDKNLPDNFYIKYVVKHDEQDEIEKQICKKTK